MALCVLKAGSKVGKYMACPIYSVDEYIFPSRERHVKVQSFREQLLFGRVCGILPSTMRAFREIFLFLDTYSVIKCYFQKASSFQTFPQDYVFIILLLRLRLENFPRNKMFFWICLQAVFVFWFCCFSFTTIPEKLYLGQGYAENFNIFPS